MTQEAKAKAAAVDAHLDPIRARLDQLTKQADDEGINVTRQTTEALLKELTALHVLEEESRAIGNQRLIARVVTERDRARAGLGFIPRKRRR